MKTSIHSSPNSTNWINSELSPFLTIKPPASPENTASLIEFERLRDLDIDWTDLVDEADEELSQYQGPSDGIVSFRSYFEDLWGETQKALNEKFLDIPNLPQSIQGNGPKDSLFEIGTRYLWDPTGEGKAEEKKSLVFSARGKEYIVLNSRGECISKVDGLTYEEFWNKYSSDDEGWHFQLCSLNNTVEEVKNLQQRVEYVSREPQLWCRLYKQILNLEKIGIGFEELAESMVKVDKLTQLFGDKISHSDLPQDIDTFKKSVLKIFDVKADADLQLSSLVQRIANAGYRLAVENITQPDPTAPDDRTRDKLLAKKGNIYKVSTYTYTWNTTHTDYITKKRRGSCGKSSSIRIPVTKTIFHAKELDKWELVDLSEDPIDKKMKQLRDEEKRVYVIKFTEKGYYSATGEPLRDIMYQCDNDESFRQKCVIVFPNYSPIITDVPNYSGATFYYSPLPGIVPSQCPRVSLKENLGYKLQWTGYQLGRLVSSINLAPGEERTISVSSKYQESVTDTRSVKSTASSEFTNTNSIEDELQTEFSRELTTSRSSSGNASVGGSYGGFSGSASASESSSTTLKTMSRQLNKAARKAASSVSNKNSIEINSSRTTSTTVSQENSRTSTISNINKGSTLNLMFYQINNQFQSGLYLQDLSICVISGTEIISGSGLYERKEYRIQQLDDVLDNLEPRDLPFIFAKNFLDDKGAPNKKYSNKYWKLLLECLVNKLKEEYAIKANINSDNESTTITANILKHFSYDPASLNFSSLPDTDIEERLGAEYEKLKSILADIDLSEEPLESTNKVLLVGTDALWMDAAVGTGYALDDYSTGLRKIEQIKSDAEAQEKLLNNKWVSILQEKYLEQSPDNVIKITNKYIDGDFAILVLDARLSHIQWDLILNGKIYSNLNISFGDDSQTTLKIKIPPKVKFKEIPVLVLLSSEEEAVIVG